MRQNYDLIKDLKTTLDYILYCSSSQILDMEEYDIEFYIYEELDSYVGLLMESSEFLDSLVEYHIIPLHLKKSLSQLGQKIFTSFKKDTIRMSSTIKGSDEWRSIFNFSDKIIYELKKSRVAPNYDEKK